MVLKLPAELYSPEQLLFCGEELHSYAAAIAQRDRGAKQFEVPELSPESQLMLEQLAPEDRKRSQSIEELRQAIEKLAVGLPTITITLAALAPSKLRTELTGWLRQNLRPDLLVRFHVNRDIAGGMIVQTTNHIYDWSWRSLLLANTNKFTAVLEKL